MKRTVWTTCLPVLILCLGVAKAGLAKDREYQSTIPSLKYYQCPEWFRDAKFGVYIHWGVYSVAEYGEWYAHRMYQESSNTYKHHLEHYGHPSEFGYKDFIPMWQAEKFDADEMVALFKKAGAQYFTPCAVHHDGFDLWDSKYNKWNSVNMGPKIDIMAEFREATAKHGLHFGATTHLARSLSWMQTSHGADKTGEKAGVPYDGNDPDYEGLYHPPHPDSAFETLDAPEWWTREWLNRLKDLIDRYRLELVYLDSGIPFLADGGQTGMQLMSYFYNRNIDWHGNHHGVFTIKNRGPKRSLYVDGTATLDLERSKTDRKYPDPWQTDDSIGPWGYKKGADYKTVNCVIDKLVDIVSKNGNLLLNVPPRADGTLDERTVEILEGIGEWFEVNGDAIYSTRPWLIYGEGPKRKMGHHDNRSPYDSENIRYTQSKDGNKINVIILDWPENQPTLQQLVVKDARNGAQVKLLGYEDPIDFSVGPDNKITLDTAQLEEEELPCKHAYCFQLTGFDVTALEPY